MIEEVGGGEGDGRRRVRLNGAHAVKRNNKGKEAAETRFVQVKGIKGGGMEVASSGKEERG